MADPFYLRPLLTSTTLYIQVMYLVFSPILWFENLAMADPFYLLPLLTSTTLYIQVLYLALHPHSGLKIWLWRTLSTCFPSSPPPLSIQVMYLVFSPILWFENLALADPFYLLQLLISTTLYPGGKKSGR